jgi:hypothetical protein
LEKNLRVIGWGSEEPPWDAAGFEQDPITMTVKARPKARISLVLFIIHPPDNIENFILYKTEISGHKNTNQGGFLSLYRAD